MSDSESLFSTDTLAFLRTRAQGALDACGVPPEGKCGALTNTLGFRAITPGGYPAVWVQDFTMNFSCGLLPRETGIQHLLLMLRAQSGDQPKQLGCNVIVPPDAIPDHINVDGSAVFFPGTYDPAANQEGKWGLCPPTNNHYDVIWLATMLAQSSATNAADLLNTPVNNQSVFQHLERAFAVPEVDPRTELVHTSAERRAVGFIFCDSIYMTGDLLMASLLRHRAAEQLAALAVAVGQVRKAETYRALARRIAASILPVFGDAVDQGGWLRAATGVSGQPDVWGSIYAIYRGLLPAEAKTRLLQTIARALEKNAEIEYQGAIRHVPVSLDASEQSVWERTITPKNRYQNGAYWHTPIGWLLAILRDSYPAHARGVRDRWLSHLVAEEGRIWECIGWDGKANQNPGFAPSITLPLGVIQALERLG
ncbi:MAG: hypothetical protein WCI73_17995 [Phycisphaerae bacterium]